MGNTKEKSGGSGYKSPVFLRLPNELIEKLKYLHKREGPMSQRTGKRKPFSTFISNILWDHVTERMMLIKALKESEWKDEDFD